MFFQLTNLKFQRATLMFAIFVVMLVSLAPSVFAIPGASNDVPGNVSNLGWVDLSATVPEDFSGSVFVHIRNTVDDSYYDIESFVLNNFKNSVQVPLGNYVVDAVSTSEDPFLYNVSCDVEEFELQNSFSLHITVTKNVAGEGYLAESSEIPSLILEPSNNNESIDSTTDVEINDSKDENTNDVSDEKASQDSQEGNLTKSPYSLLISFVISVCLILVVGFVMWKIKNR